MVDGELSRAGDGAVVVMVALVLPFTCHKSNERYAALHPLPLIINP